MVEGTHVKKPDGQGLGRPEMERLSSIVRQSDLAHKASKNPEIAWPMEVTTANEMMATIVAPSSAVINLLKFDRMNIAEVQF
jgi:hypothetical protein